MGDAAMVYRRSSLGWYRLRFNTASTAANLLAAAGSRRDAPALDPARVTRVGYDALIDVLTLCRDAHGSASVAGSRAAASPEVSEYARIALVPSVVLAAGLVIEASDERLELSEGALDSMADVLLTLAELALDAAAAESPSADQQSSVEDETRVDRAERIVLRVSELPGLSAKTLYNLACAHAAIARRRVDDVARRREAMRFLRRALVLSPRLEAAARRDPTLVGVLPSASDADARRGLEVDEGA